MRIGATMEGYRLLKYPGCYMHVKSAQGLGNLPITLGNVSLSSPVFLAPMAGITDLPFRKTVLRFGAGLVVSEMVASQELVQAKPSARAKAELGLDNANTAVQIAGRDAYWMAECAKLLAGQGARIIDINMGCPARKVTTGNCGSALMKEPALAASLIKAVVNAVDVPVSLKMRLGWDDAALNAPEIAQMAEGAGVQMVTIHGRTRCQFYKGSADWQAIASIKNVVSIPVIANGDIVDVKSARTALTQSGADGVMIGRGVQGKPWILARVAAELAGDTYGDIPQADALLEVILTHYAEILRFYGMETGVRTARKHLGWYLEHLEGAKELRRAVLTESDAAKVMRLLSQGIKNCGALLDTAA